MVFVIDGPAGSGKSSTAKAVAQSLQLIYLDSGAVYRAVTWLRLKTEKDRFFDVLNSSNLRFAYQQGAFRIWVNGDEVTGLIRTPEIDREVSAVAADGAIREVVNQLMRRYTESGYYIADGRDLGTVVFPDAPVKFFMTADLNARAERRFQEQQHAGVDQQQIAEGLQKRDEIDSSRPVAPLKKADDAISIDTTGLKFEDQVRIIEEKIRPYLANM